MSSSTSMAMSSFLNRRSIAPVELTFQIVVWSTSPKIQLRVQPSIITEYIPFLPGLAMMSRHLLVRPKVDIRREPDVSVTPNFVNTQSSNPVVNADPKLEFSVDHSPATAQPKPVSHSVTTPPTTPNVFR
ncbi:hypothetical protein RJ639_010332 [Escallonia herrerae]|uniref:Uncharacterized protein n=1 Tax=Escallonia herrerae TaxID=1293975 RepID=A0AA88W0F8_9ASTE|nr:hypothetical protein RJ639_010332 [Escallonia herrerae]